MDTDKERIAAFFHKLILFNGPYTQSAYATPSARTPKRTSTNPNGLKAFEMAIPTSMPGAIFLFTSGTTQRILLTLNCMDAHEIGLTNVSAT